MESKNPDFVTGRVSATLADGSVGPAQIDWAAVTNHPDFYRAVCAAVDQMVAEGRLGVNVDEDAVNLYCTGAPR